MLRIVLKNRRASSMWKMLGAWLAVVIVLGASLYPAVTVKASREDSISVQQVYAGEERRKRLATDREPRPVVKSISAQLLSSGNIRLSVVMDKQLVLYRYQWYIQNSNQDWVPLSGATEAVSVVGNDRTGTTLHFRVEVTRTSDERTVMSGAVSVAVPEPETTSSKASSDEPSVNDSQVQENSSREESSAPSQESGTQGSSPSPPKAQQPAPAPSASSQQESTITGDGSLSLEISTLEPIYTGGRVTITPSEEGGEWEWNDTILSTSSRTPSEFTALGSGTATVSYTLDEQTVTAEFEILPSMLPATGQSITPVLVTGSFGMLCLLGAGALRLHRRKEAQYDRGKE